MLLLSCLADEPVDIDADDDAICDIEELEHCGFNDAGWNHWCETGVVYRDDLTEALYCNPGEADPFCSTGGAGDETPLLDCTAGCATDDIAWVETLAELADFDPAALCDDSASTTGRATAVRF